MVSIVGHVTRRSRDVKNDRLVRKLVKQYPDVWPVMVVTGEEDWRDMPADQFDWALDEIKKRMEKQHGRRR